MRKILLFGGGGGRINQLFENMLWMVVGALSVMNWFEVPINKQLTEVNQHGNGE